MRCSKLGQGWWVCCIRLPGRVSCGQSSDARQPIGSRLLHLSPISLQIGDCAAPHLTYFHITRVIIIMSVLAVMIVMIIMNVMIAMMHLIAMFLMID